jgi:hypothetical protein
MTLSINFNKFEIIFFTLYYFQDKLYINFSSQIEENLYFKKTSL